MFCLWSKYCNFYAKVKSANFFHRIFMLAVKIVKANMNIIIGRFGSRVVQELALL